MKELRLIKKALFLNTIFLELMFVFILNPIWFFTILIHQVLLVFEKLIDILLLKFKFDYRVIWFNLNVSVVFFKFAFLGIGFNLFIDKFFPIIFCFKVLRFAFLLDIFVKALIWKKYLLIDCWALFFILKLYFI